MFNLVSMFTCIQAVTTVASRMVLSFARDRGFGPASPALMPVHAKLRVPVYSIVFVTAWAIIFGLIYLGSSTALNAILSAAILFVQASYAVPIAVMFVRGDEALAGQPKSWSLGRWRRPINAFALAFVLLTSVCFVFPPALPVSGPTMNYAVVVLGVVLIMCAVTWLIDGRKNFSGPTHLEERLLAARSA
jgi:amino acid transporter